MAPPDLSIYMTMLSTYQVMAGGDVEWEVLGGMAHMVKLHSARTANPVVRCESEDAGDP